MKIFAIRDEEEKKPKDLAYLIYYERAKRFYIELPEDADPWETPLLLSSFAKRGERSINAYWSRMWVQQRIIPTDRQNLGAILKENGLAEYDEYALLMLANGRCAQDSLYLAPVDQAYIELEFADRYEKKIEDVIPLQHNHLLVFFRNGQAKICDVTALAGNNRTFAPVLKNEEKFRMVSIQVGGYGVCWGDNLLIPDHALYGQGVSVPLSLDDFICFANSRVVSTAEAAELLGCSRQNVNELAAKGKLHPVRVEQKNKFFLKSEILQRLWR